MSRHACSWVVVVMAARPTTASTAGRPAPAPSRTAVQSRSPADPPLLKPCRAQPPQPYRSGRSGNHHDRGQQRGKPVAVVVPGADDRVRNRPACRLETLHERKAPVEEQANDHQERASGSSGQGRGAPAATRRSPGRSQRRIGEDLPGRLRLRLRRWPENRGCRGSKDHHAAANTAAPTTTADVHSRARQRFRCQSLRQLSVDRTYR